MKLTTKFLILICELLYFVVFKIKCDCPYGISAHGLTQNDKNLIVSKHNNLRQLVAMGLVPGQPKATNMQSLQWDDYLAQEAQKIADTCVYAHVKVQDRRWYVGQNLAIQMSTRYTNYYDWNWAIQAWFDEYRLYKYSNTFSHETGHYTQVVWANTRYVGCGFVMFQSNSFYRYNKMYVCNYGPAGNIIGQFPYRIN